MRPTPRLRTLAALALCPAALAQTPFVPLADIWVSDSNLDRIARVRDLNFDGDYNDFGEVDIFYDDTLGPYALTNNNGIVTRLDGSVWVSDTGPDQILRMVDLNGDGNAHGFSETTIFFESAINPAGIVIQSPLGMCWQGNVLWLANAQSGTTGKDMIVRLEDLNGDGDAMDAGEAIEYWVSSDLSLGGSAGDSNPQDVQAGLDGALYYLDIGTTGVYSKGIYKLVDLDGSGVIDAPNEITPFFIPPAQAGAAFFWNLEQDSEGYWYLADTGNDFIWRARDDNGDGVIDPISEATKYWISPGASTVWDLHVSADGALYVSESQNNERFFVMRDANADGSIDPVTEVAVVYDELLTLGAAIGQIRGWDFDARQQAPSTTYCAAQVNTLGCSATFSVAGWPSVSQPSGCLLTVSNLRNQKTGVMFYGLSGRANAPFNGGTLCVQPPTRRTGTQFSGGTAFGDDCSGAMTFDLNAWIASGADASLVLGAVVNAQYWSRDPGAAPINSNVSDAVEVHLLR